MNRIITIVFISLFLTAPTYAEQLSISMVYSNSSAIALPIELFSKGTWQPDPNATYVKLHLYLDRPVKMSSFEVIPCDKPLSYPVTVFANFDEWLSKIDADSEMPAPLPSSKNNSTQIKGKVYKDTDVRSLTFNFERNRGFALCGIKLYDPKGGPYEIVVPRIVDGNAVASSTLEPIAAYDVMNLFDSRFESAWASNKQAADVELKFDFQQEQNISKLRIWSGYQRSPEHCIANSRPKLLRIDGDNGYTTKVSVQDIMGAQEITLPKIFTGKSLRITVENSYQGKSYADLVISELRFGNVNGWFMLDPLPHIRAGITENRMHFRESNLQSALDSGLSSEDNAILRLRSDGSFYLSGTRSTESSGDMNYFAIGNYEIKGKDPVKGLRLRLFGLFHESEAYGDCNGCGRDCNRVSANKEKIFQEVVWLKLDKNGDTILTSVSANRLSKIPITFAPDNRSQARINK